VSGLVPRDFVIDAMDQLSVLDRSEGRTYALTDPEPADVRTARRHLRRAPGQAGVWVPAATRAHPRGRRVGARAGAPAGPAGRGLDYFATHTTYSTANAVADLEGTGVKCPPFAELRRHAAGLHGRPSRVRLLGDGLSQARSDRSPEEEKSHRATRLVVNVSLAGSDRDYDEHVTFLDHDFRIAASGPNGDVAPPRTWSEVGGRGRRDRRHRDPRGTGGRALRRRPRRRREGQAGHPAVPVTDGHALRDVLQEWSIRHVQTEMPGYFTNARTVVLGGANHDRTIRILREYTDNFEFADPLLRLDLSRRLTPTRCWAGHRHRPVAGPAAARVRQAQVKAPGRRISHALARQGRRDCDVVVATYEELIGFGLEDLRGKTVVTSAISDERLADLGPAASTWCSTPRRSRSTSPSTRPCSRR
jgi:hypothetical protein